MRGCSAVAAREAAQSAARLVGVPFDYNYNWQDTTRLYCTQLIAVAYSSAGIDLLSGVPRLSGRNTKNIIVFPGDIASNDSLTTIFRF